MLSMQNQKVQSMSVFMGNADGSVFTTMRMTIRFVRTVK
jgi:hypothetical protein